MSASSKVRRRRPGERFRAQHAYVRARIAGCFSALGLCNQSGLEGHISMSTLISSNVLLVTCCICLAIIPFPGLLSRPTRPGNNCTGRQSTCSLHCLHAFSGMRILASWGNRLGASQGRPASGAAICGGACLFTVYVRGVMRRRTGEGAGPRSRRCRVCLHGRSLLQ